MQKTPASKERKLFGTDGVRGVANIEPMTTETAMRLGRAVAHLFHRPGHRSKIVIGNGPLAIARKSDASVTLETGTRWAREEITGLSPKRVKELLATQGGSEG